MREMTNEEKQAKPYQGHCYVCQQRLEMTDETSLIWDIYDHVNYVIHKQCGSK